jgi:hypothetical protein
MRKAKGMPVDSCGCAMSAKFLAVGLVASVAWYAWRWSTAGSTLSRAALHVALYAFGAAMVGKVVGLAIARKRQPTR